jgi:hypothetical protein
MEENITTGQIGKKYGIIYGLIGTLIAVIPMVLEIQNNWIGMLGTVLAIIIYIIATKEFRADNGGFMSFNEGFKITMIAAAIAGVIRAAVTYIYIKVLDPGFSERMRETMIETWQSQGLSDEAIETSLRFAGGISNPEIAAMLGVGTALLGGLLWGSIVSAVNKNESEESF